MNIRYLGMEPNHYDLFFHLKKNPGRIGRKQLIFPAGPLFFHPSLPKIGQPPDIKVTFLESSWVGQKLRQNFVSISYKGKILFRFELGKLWFFSKFGQKKDIPPSKWNAIITKFGAGGPQMTIYECAKFRLHRPFRFRVRWGGRSPPPLGRG